MPKLINHERRRQDLVDVAWSLIAIDGVYAATVRRVAELAHVAAGSVRYIFPTQEELLLAVADELERRLTADIARRHTTSLNKEKAVHRLVAALPLLREQDDIWAVETAFRLNTTQDPRLADIVGTTWRLRSAECREILVILTAGIDVPASTLDFELQRTMAMMDGLSTQLRAGRQPILRDDARAILTRHLREVQKQWQREGSPLP